MKSIRITFRLTPEQLARCLETIRANDPAYKLTSINELVKKIYTDYNKRLSTNHSNDVAQTLIDEIIQIQSAKKRKSLTIEDLLELAKVVRVPK